MAATKKEKSVRIGKFSWFAVLLLILALVGFFLSLSPKGIGDMWQETLKDLKARESVLSLLDRTLSSGTVEVTGTGEGAFTATAAMTLPDAASLSYEGEESFLLAAKGDKVTLRQGEENSSAGRASALAAFDASHYAGEEGALPQALRAFLLFTETRQDLGEILRPYEKALKKNAPRRQDSRETLESGEGSVTADLIRYEFDAKALLAVLTQWQKTLPEDEALRDAAEDLVRSLYALEGKTAPQGLLDRLNALLTGSDGTQAALSAGLAEGKGCLTAEFWAYRGRICRVHLTWELPLNGETLRGESTLNLGLEPKKSAARSLAVTALWTGGEAESRFALTLSDSIAENSKSAFVREMEFSLEDESFRVLVPTAEGEVGQKSLSLRFSWGKQRGDLGLRLVTPEKTVQFRGEMTEYKAGKRVQFTIRRIEVDGENQIPDSAITVLIHPGAQLEEAAAAELDLFRAPPVPEEPVPEEPPAEPAPENPEGAA